MQFDDIESAVEALKQGESIIVWIMKTEKMKGT